MKTSNVIGLHLSRDSRYNTWQCLLSLKDILRSSQLDKTKEYKLYYNFMDRYLDR